MSKSNSQNTPIQKFVKLIKKSESQKIAQLLQDPSFVSSGVINDLDPKTGKTLLQIAIQSEEYDIFNMLLKINGVKLDQIAKDGSTALQSAILMNSIQSVQQILRAKPQGMKILNGQSHSALYTSIFSKSSPEIIKKLLFHSNQFNVNQKIPTYNSLLNLAIFTGQLDVFSLLLNTPNIDLKINDDQDNTSLMIAVKNKKGDFVQILLKKLQEMYIESNNDGKKGMSQIEIQFYLNHGDQKGDTVLHIAAKKDYQAILDFLLKQGIKLGLDPQLKNKQGKTYLSIIQQRQSQRQKSQLQAQSQQRKRIQERQIKKKQKQQQRLLLQKQQQIQKVAEKKKKKQQEILQIKKHEMQIQMERNRKIWGLGIALVVLFGLAYLLFLGKAGKITPSTPDSF